MYRTLVANAIPVPLHIIVDREGLPPGARSGPAQPPCDSPCLNRHPAIAAGADPPGFVETEDYVEMNGARGAWCPPEQTAELLRRWTARCAGVRIVKPFVEKPGSAEDHNVHIYYPHSMVSRCRHCSVTVRCHACARVSQLLFFCG